MVQITSNVQVSKRLDDGTILVLGAEQWSDFVALAQAALGAGSNAVINQFAALVPASAGAVTEQQAVANIQQAFPNAQVSTVGQPLPQPGNVVPFPQPLNSAQQNSGVPVLPVASQAPQAAAAAPVVPPGVDYPGDCPHGTRVYVDKPAKGRPWRRWECAIPWSPETKDQRCKPVNV